jgi:myo-inositol 2-dehydrogenase / D-chiro-inositol 1-dehydrogenase
MTNPRGTDRRTFLKTSAVAGAAASLGVLPAAHAAGTDVIKVGVIGCGGRGKGAAENICEAAGSNFGIKIHALGDVFSDRVQDAFSSIKGSPLSEGKFDVTPDRCFSDFDAYQKVIDCCDLVILATPPGFRPQHLEAAVKASKNIFTEKPVAVDGTGIRKVLKAAEDARAKNLAIVTGTQRRHQAGYLQSMKLIKEGGIGDVITGRVFWNQNNIWAHQRQSGWNDMENAIRNWYHYTWLCGGCIVEQHVHNLDVALWAFGSHPVSCVGMGGREVNTGPEFGESFDHFAVDYEFGDGRHLLSMCRQINGCAGDVSEYFAGSKGSAHLSPGSYQFSGNGLENIRIRKEVNPYVQEHIDLLASIRDGKPLNELKQVAESTLTAIMGRMSAFTGKAVSWDQALNSKLDTFPQTLAWGPLPPPEIAKPGTTPLV